MTRIASRTVRIVLLVLVALTVASRPTAQVADFRTIQFETTEVTAPDVAVSPDGEWLIFTMLGKLFRLPSAGGEAEQLTFGPYYDNDPAISPDGKRVAFQSDRDGSEGNIFVLTLADKEIRQLTRESWADGPAWTPDGRSLVYLQLDRRAWNPVDAMPRPPAVVRRVPLAGGEPETLHPLAHVWSVFHLRDGRVGWAIVERDAASRLVQTRIEAMESDGSLSVVRVLDGAADPVRPGRAADGFYARLSDDVQQPPAGNGSADIMFVPLSENRARRVFPLSGERGGFAVAGNDAALYVGNQGRLWKVAPRGGRRESVPVRARVTLAVRERVAAPVWTPIEPGAEAGLRTIYQPQLSLDGSRLVFRAIGRLWQQPVDSGQAQPLINRPSAESDPAFPAPASRSGLSMLRLGQWLAGPVPNRHGIRLTKLGGEVGGADLAQVVEAADGHEFSFTADGEALLYVAGDTLWRKPLTGGPTVAIPIRLELRAPVPPPVLLRRARLVDFDAGGFGAETSLLIDGGRIRWIGAEAGRELPAGTQIVDAGGRLAIPGLFDMHGHDDACGNAARISYGVTSVRNMGGRITAQNADADRGDFTNDPLSRCFYSGRMMGAAAGRSEDHRFVYTTDEQDARALVRRMHSQGAHFIKLFTYMPWSLQRAATDEARRLGLPAMSPGLTLEQAVKGVTLGFAGLTVWGYSNSLFYYDDALQMFAAAGTRWEPALGVSGSVLKGFRENPQRFPAARGQSLDSDDVVRGQWVERMRTVRAGYRRGIIFVPGGDHGPDGLALHWELEFFAEAGIPPLDILRFATKVAAETVGAQDHLGTLDVGKLADMVLLDANPLEDIKNTRAIWRVLKGGWMFDPAVLLPNR